MSLIDTAISDPTPLKPFLKWAGGKRWFIHNYADLLPRTFNTYIEPFLGSGAVYFYLQPKKALLGDLNIDLINTYKALKLNWKLVFRYLQQHHRNHGKRYYYSIRKNIPRSLSARAARFIYLNRTCWNGLYRVNLQGTFNVPIGSKSSVLFEDDCFDSISLVLKNAELHHADFERLIDQGGNNDLIFVDPPYTVRHNHNAFIKYNETLFSWFDQERLYYALKRALSRGAIIVGTNAYHSSVCKLYKGEFNLLSVSRNSPISSKASTRKKYEELVILYGVEP